MRRGPGRNRSSLLPVTGGPGGEPATLYHFTTADGLQGIVEKVSLWATDAEFLNDSQELQFGRPELVAALTAEADRIQYGAAEGGPDYARGAVLRSTAETLRSGAPPAATQEHLVHVACFCAADDLLSQWRGYGAGGGFAIGFDRAALAALPPIHHRIDHSDEHVHGDPLTVHLIQVRYGPEAIDPAIRQVLATLAPGPVGHPGATGWVRTQTVALPALAGIKHPAFAEEQEWRLLVAGEHQSMKFRIGPAGLVPYLPIPVPASAVVEVVIGPGGHADLRERGVRRLLWHYQLHHVNVRRSVAPFRG